MIVKNNKITRLTGVTPVAFEEFDRRKDKLYSSANKLVKEKPSSTRFE